MNRPPRRRLTAALATALALAAAGCQTTPAHETPDHPAAAHDRHERARQILAASAADPDPQLRLRAVEAARHLGDDAAPLVTAATTDPHPVVRYAAWTTAGRLGLAGLAAPARAAAQRGDEPDYVRAAAAFASARLADGNPPADLAPLAGLLWSDRAGMRANAAVLLGESGEPSARPMLRDAAKHPTARASAVDQALLDLQIHEALVKLGDPDQLKPLRIAAYSKDDEVRVLAVLMLGRLDDRTMEGAIMSLLSQDPQELRLAAAQALGNLGWPDGLPAALQGAASPHQRIRAQAALALGRVTPAIPAADTTQNNRARAAAHAALGRLLDDEAAAVRLSAAAALLEPAR